MVTRGGSWKCCCTRRAECSHLGNSGERRPDNLTGDMRGLIAVVAQKPTASAVVDPGMGHEFKPGQQPRPGYELHRTGMDAGMAGQHARPDCLPVKGKTRLFGAGHPLGL